MFQSKLFDALPFFILGVVSFMAAATVACLPETADAKLPDTVAEAEVFGKDQGLFPIPFLERRRFLAKMREAASSENKA